MVEAIKQIPFQSPFSGASLSYDSGESFLVKDILVFQSPFSGASLSYELRFSTMTVTGL